MRQNISNIEMSRKVISAFCRRNHINRLSLFGSVLRADFKPESDIDILVEFEKGHVPGFEIVAIENELSTILSRKADMHTKNELSRYFRDQVISEAVIVYEARQKPVTLGN